MTHAQRNAAIAAKISAYTERHTRTKADAMRALVREGFYLPNGKVAPEFAPLKKDEKASV